MARKKRIFISYSRKDSDVVDAICKVLPAEEVDVFVDRTGIHGAEDFVSRLANEILLSDLVLFIASRNSYASRYVKKELIYTMDKGIPVLPYLIDSDPLPDDIAFLLGDINFLKRQDNPVDENLGREILLAASDKARRVPLAGRRNGRSGKAFLIGLPAVCAIVVGAILFLKPRQPQPSAAQAALSQEVQETLLHATQTFRQADSLRALNTPDETGEEEIDILLGFKAEVDRLDSLSRQESPPVALPSSVGIIRKELNQRLDSIYDVWTGQARIALGLYKKTHMEQEYTFATNYLQRAGRIKKDAEWKRLSDEL